MKNIEDSAPSATKINYRTLEPSKSGLQVKACAKGDEDAMAPKPAASKWLTWSKVDLAMSGMLAAANAVISVQYARRAYNCPCERQTNTVLAGVYMGIAGIWTATTMLKNSRIAREQRLAA